MTRDQIIDRLSDREVVALTIRHEARPTTAGRVSVGAVIAARVRDGRYGETFRLVCLKRLQFSCWWPEGGASNHARLMTTAERLASGDQSAWAQDAGLRECDAVAHALMTASAATHYVTTALYRASPPAWSRGKPIAGEVDGHLFFEGVDG